MALLDDLFEGLATEKKEEDPAKAPDSEKKPQDVPAKEDEKPDEDGDGEEAEKDSPLFPTGKDWEDFKAGRTRA